jgi:hypothetical protein
VSTVSLDESRMEDIAQVTDEENEQLVEPFSEEEVWCEVFRMEHNKATGSDGFPVEFYQAC